MVIHPDFHIFAVMATALGRFPNIREQLANSKGVVTIDMNHGESVDFGKK